MGQGDGWAGARVTLCQEFNWVPMQLKNFFIVLCRVRDVHTGNCT